MTRTKWLNFGLIAAAVLLVGLLAFAVVGDSVSANDDTPEEPTETPEEETPASGFGPGPNRPGRDRARNFLRYGKEAALNSIAEQTGISVEELEAAIEDNSSRITDLLTEAGYSEDEIDEIMLNAQYAAIDQAVTDGKLTEEQAKQAKERLVELDIKRDEWMENRAAYHSLWLALISEKSGIAVEDIETAIDNGETVYQLLQETMTAEEAQALMEEAWSKMIEQALSEGLLSEEQAQAMQEHVPFRQSGPRERFGDRLEGRFGDDWQSELRQRMGPDCNCDCSNSGE